MEQKVINRTRSTQQIHFANGSCVTVYPGNSEKVDFNDIFPDEKERIKKFFIIEDRPKPRAPVRSTKSKNTYGGE